MKVYSAKHNGHYPVGACSIIVAENRRTARRILKAELASRGLSLEDIEMEEVETDVQAVHVILEGQY